MTEDLRQKLFNLFEVTKELGESIGACGRVIEKQEKTLYDLIKWLEKEVSR